MPGPFAPPALHPHLGGVLTRPQTPEPRELPSASAGPEVPAWSQHTQSCLERPKMPRKWARVWEVHRVYTCGTVLRAPVIWEGVRGPGASEAGHKSKDTDLDLDKNAAGIQRQAQM